MIAFNVTEAKLMPAQPARRSFKYKTKIYIWPEGETLLENLYNRRNRPIKEFRKAAEKALDSLGVDRTKLDMRWSQKAGCGCGCSPGFIVDGWNEKLYLKDLHVTVE